LWGTPSDSNIPGARCYSISWIDSDGNLWLFGGYGYDTDKDFNDLWKFNPLTGEWTWVSGSNTTGQPGAYGTMGTASNTNIPGARSSGVSWADASGNLWLFGGYGYGSSNAGDYGDLNDLWKFTPSTEEWTWVSGSDETSQLGRYGIKETPSVSNIPGARSYSISWIDLSGNLWLFGGYGYDSSDSGGYGELNDLWKFEP
jgi:N-acetylneuraminic acid mutarotase